jgi:hypothetical protein
MGMVGFLVENIYVVFEDQVLQQSAGIVMGTNCTHLLADVSLYSYEVKVTGQKQNKYLMSSNHIYRYTD